MRSLETESTTLRDVLVLRPDVHADERGHFFESWNSERFAELAGEVVEFVQDNHSHSKMGVLRGLHYQIPPKPQGKLVRVAHGSVFDVAVDIRRSSQTFGDWTALELSDDNCLQLWVPPGFAHGFVALTDQAVVVYKVTEYFSAEHDRSVRWDDPDIGIEWPLEGAPILSDKDANAPYLRDAETFA